MSDATFDIEQLFENNTQMVDIRRHMVNNELCSDVEFIFKQEAKTIKAHKFCLITASPVFFKMFCGPFESKPDIAITDIDSDDFLEVLHYIYGTEVNLSTENMFQLWYAAEKYMLDSLKEQCIDFVKRNIDRDNLLRIFNEVQIFDNEEVDIVCLAMILDSPFEHIKAEKFLNKLNEHAFRKLMQQPRINCTDDDLKVFALRWLNRRKGTNKFYFTDKVYRIFEAEYGVKRTDFENKRLYDDINVHYLAATHFRKFWMDKTRIVKTGFAIYGLGIYLGVADTNHGDDTLESIILSVEDHSQKTAKFLMTKYIKVQQTRTMTILKVMFNKIVVDHTNIYITIDFGKNRSRVINPTAIPKGTTFLNYQRFDGDNKLESLNGSEYTCVAYLIEKRLEGPSRYFQPDDTFFFPAIKDNDKDKGKDE